MSLIKTINNLIENIIININIKDVYITSIILKMKFIIIVFLALLGAISTTMIIPKEIKA